MSAGRSIIQYVGFRLSGDKDRLRASHGEITSCELLDTNGAPVPEGVYDLRMGTTDHNYECLTCLHGKKLCPGHSGHLQLRIGIPQPVAIAEIRRWLRVTCLNCGEIVVDRDKYEHFAPSRRLVEASLMAEGKKCPNCSIIHPKIIKDEEDYFTFLIESPSAEKKGAQENRIRLLPDTIRAILERISDSSVVSLGRSPVDSPPGNLIVRIAAIPPNTIRPGVKNYGGAGASYHDSTNLLQRLIRENKQLPEKIPEELPTPGQSPDNSWKLLHSIQNIQQIYYELIMGSSRTSVTQGNNGRRSLVIGSRSVHSFLRNLPRKEGRIRANLLGARVFYVSRSTISGNMRFKVYEVGIPMAFARTLQVEETVQEYNRDWLMPFFLNGRRQYPGSTYVLRRETREMHDISGLRNIRLEIGDVIFRDVIDGDYAYFNRQPTLERSSIAVMRVLVIQDPSIHTFQMNVLACEWFNADFDGDQMNLWIARGPAARAEAMIMSSADNWYISTKTSNPVNGQVQDSVIGCHELTRAGIVMDRYHAMGLFATTDIEPPEFSEDQYTGRDIVSLLFAGMRINYNRTPSSYKDLFAPYIKYDKSDIHTVMENGRLIMGVLDKKSVGAKEAGSIFHLVSREYGAHRALDMIYALQQVALQLLLYRGFTVGAADLLPSTEALEQIRQSVSSVLLESNVITERLLRGEIIAPIDDTVHGYYEKLQKEALKLNESEILRWVLGSIHPDTNGFFRMISAGSKGSEANLIHVAGAIGQTKINEERIREQFSFRRTLPYFPRFSTDPAAYGFVANNYMLGMTSSEFIFQDMNGRYDLINKALSTSITGYFTRKGVMSNQSSLVNNHRHVTKDTKIVQFIYGEDGLDSRELEKVTFTTINLSNTKLKEAMWVDLKSAAGTKDEIQNAQAAVDKAVSVIQKDRDSFREIQLRIEKSNFGKTFATEYLMPVNIRRLVMGLIADPIYQKTPKTIVAKVLQEEIERVWELCERIPYTLVNEIQERLKTRVLPHKVAATFLLCALIRAELNPRVLVSLDSEQLKYIFGTIRLRYSQSLIDYGTAAGVLAAQAISEPLTQYMLDSHHRSVAGGTNKSGLVRVSEIYGVKPISEEQSPAMQFLLRPEVLGGASGALGVAQELANSIEYVTLLRFVKQYDTLLEPYGSLIYPPYANDQHWIAEYEKSHPLVRIPGDLTNWCFRFMIDKASLELKAMDLELIINKMRSGGLYIVHTPESVPEPLIRVWILASLVKGSGKEEDLVRSVLDKVLNTTVRGIEGIIRASAEKIVRHKIGEDGALLEEEIYGVATVGTNLYKVLLHGSVDHTQVITTSIGDTERIYGIEAARAKIISETRSFMSGNTPNLRHLFLYADELTRTGKWTGIERGGLGTREHNNVLLRMSYGDPIKVITDAVLAGAKSKIYGIAAPQLLGSIPQIGTLYNTVLVDDVFVGANMVTVNKILDSL